MSNAINTHSHTFTPGQSKWSETQQSLLKIKIRLNTKMCVCALIQQTANILISLYRAYDAIRLWMCFSFVVKLDGFRSNNNFSWHRSLSHHFIVHCNPNHIEWRCTITHKMRLTSLEVDKTLGHIPNTRTYHILYGCLAARRSQRADGWVQCVLHIQITMCPSAVGV